MSLTVSSGLIIGIPVAREDFFEEAKKIWRCKNNHEREHEGQLYCPLCGSVFRQYESWKPNARFEAWTKSRNQKLDNVWDIWPREGDSWSGAVGEISIGNASPIQGCGEQLILVLGIMLVKIYADDVHEVGKQRAPVTFKELDVAIQRIRGAADDIDLTTDREICLYPFLYVS